MCAFGRAGFGQLDAVRGVVAARAGDDAGPVAHRLQDNAEQSSFSSSLVVGDSPVVPETTKPSHPASTRWFARRAAAAVSKEPSGPNGVAIAVRRVPNRRGGIESAVLTAPRLPGDAKLFSTRANARVSGFGR